MTLVSSKHPFADFRFCPKCGGPFGIHNEKACRCECCGFVYYFNPSAATVAVIINDNDELLVCRRAKEPALGTLDLPGGFCDMFETAEEGVSREVKEETGAKVISCTYLFSLPNTYLYSGFLVHTIDVFFRCQLAEYTDIRACDDASECMWIPLRDVEPDKFGLDSIRQGVKQVLSLFSTSLPYGE